MACHSAALYFLEFKTTVLSTEAEAHENHQFQRVSSVEGEQQVGEATPVVPQ